MTAEPFTFRIAKDGDFDGFSQIVLTRDDFTVTGQRYFQKNLVGPAGVISSDFFGCSAPSCSCHVHHNLNGFPDLVPHGPIRNINAAATCPTSPATTASAARWPSGWPSTHRFRAPRPT